MRMETNANERKAYDKGRPLGAFADDEELDRSDLNKCPDCNCFFDGRFCPSCGKECTEEMRAGNRPAVKRARKKRTTTIPTAWYYAWWFIVLMLFVFPIVGIVLIVTSPHDTWKKVLAVVIALACLLFPIGLAIGGSLLSGIADWFESPVDDSITKEEYIARCESVTPEQFYRLSDAYEGKFVSLTLKVTESVTCVDEYYNDEEDLCYLCEAENGSEYKLIVRDCLLDERQRFIAGDVIVVYGEGAGDREAYDAEYNYTTNPCVNMAYVVRK